MNADVEVDVEGHRIKLSNLDKIFYPQTRFTKAEVIRYYTQIAPVLLPHLRDRPLTLKRYPEGVEGGHFYEKECPAYRPEWVATAPIQSEGRDRIINYCLIKDLATLVWVANLADLELHTSLSTYPDIARPTMLVFDLDPGAPAAILECAQVALRLRALFNELGLECLAKTSGSKGIQVYVPLNTTVSYEATKGFARTVAELLERRDPGEVTANMNKSARGGKIFIDWSQNDEAKTTVCVYSLRAKNRPTVSAPITWEEIEHAWRHRRAQALDLDHRDVLARVARYGDLFEPALTRKQQLPALA